MSIQKHIDKLDAIPLWIADRIERKEKGFVFVLPFGLWYARRVFGKQLKKNLEAFSQLEKATGGAAKAMKVFGETMGGNMLKGSKIKLTGHQPPFFHHNPHHETTAFLLDTFRHYLPFASIYLTS